MPAPLKLITISISHYVEKVKWALALSGLAYAEESHIPGLHALATLWHTRGSHRATPVLIDGSLVVPDSTAILRHLSTKYAQKWLYPNAQVIELEERFDRNIGPHTRRYIYQQLFENDLSIADLFSQGNVPQWEIVLLRLMAPAIKEGMIRDMAIHPRAAENSRLIFEREFAFVAEQLRDGRRYLCGDALTAADITFAALSAPVLLPDNYGARLPRLEQAAKDSAIHAIVDRYRTMPAGQFALQLYREHRPQQASKNY